MQKVAEHWLSMHQWPSVFLLKSEVDMIPNIIGIVLLIVLAWMVYDIKRTPSASVEKSASTKNNYFPFGGWLVSIGFMHLIVMTIAFVCLVYVGYKNSPKNSDTNIDTGGGAVIMMPAPEDIRPIETQDDGPVEQMGVLSWYKPVGVNGGNPALRKFSSKVEILRNDSEKMVFIFKYYYEGEYQKARFQWNKNEPSGIWSQKYPQDGGRWHLEQTSATTFEGDHSDKHGSIIPIKLELI
jgi:hypothetical protein